MKILWVFLSLMLAKTCFAVEQFCDTNKPHDIDVQLEKELGKSGGVTSVIRNAQSKAYELWDRELNKSYKELLASLKPADQELLKQSQRAWLVFRDAQVKLLWGESLYGAGGSLSPIVVSDLSREAVKQRVCDLTMYKHVAESGGP